MVNNSEYTIVSGLRVCFATVSVVISEGLPTLKLLDEDPYYLNFWGSDIFPVKNSIPVTL